MNSTEDGLTLVRQEPQEADNVQGRLGVYQNEKKGGKRMRMSSDAKKVYFSHFLLIVWAWMKKGEMEGGGKGMM